MGREITSGVPGVLGFHGCGRIVANPETDKPPGLGFKVLRYLGERVSCATGELRLVFLSDEISAQFRSSSASNLATGALWRRRLRAGSSLFR